MSDFMLWQISCHVIFHVNQVSCQVLMCIVYGEINLVEKNMAVKNPVLKIPVVKIPLVKNHRSETDPMVKKCSGEGSVHY